MKQKKHAEGVLFCGNITLRAGIFAGCVSYGIFYKQFIYTKLLHFLYVFVII